MVLQLPSPAFYCVCEPVSIPVRVCANALDNQHHLSGGRNISHVLTYNEPDGTSATGGSAISPDVAAANWISQVEPLRKLGVKVSAPAVTGSPGGFTWLASFFDACASLGTNCTADFIPVHWYGNFEGLASHLGQVAATSVTPP